MMARKIIGISALVAFVLLASSAVCLASVQVSAMNDCSTGHGAAAAVCPFMSVSIPAIATGATLAIVIILLFVAIETIVDTQALAGISFQTYNRRRTGFHASSFGPVISLISRGVLHSRVYDF